jgi:hypothetical protein
MECYNGQVDQSLTTPPAGPDNMARDPVNLNKTLKTLS